MKYFISHRGNINGVIESDENNPVYIDLALKKGYDVEIDVWYVGGELWLGHDKPQYNVEFRWFRDRLSNLWVHCKNVEAINYFSDCGYEINYFWHENDKVTLTSKRIIWAYPSKETITNSIAVMPEIYNPSLIGYLGICSDYIENYKNEYTINIRN